MDAINLNEKTRNEDLDSSGWEHVYIPIKIRSFIWLKKMDFSNNLINIISYGDFPPLLEYLDLSRNEIKHIDKFVLPSTLKCLNLDKNYILTINLSILINLEILKISMCGLNEIILPNKLMSLNISDNELVKIDGIPDTLIEFNCENNKLHELPDLMHCKNLLILSCRDNYLTSFPKLPSSLTRIDVSDNRISTMDNTLPRDLIELLAYSNDISIINAFIPLNLEILDLSMNHIVQIPNLPAGIKEVILSGNDIEELDDQDIPLGVEKLDINSNKIKAMPQDLLQRPNLTIKMDGNQLDDENDDDDDGGTTDPEDTADFNIPYFNSKSLFDNNDDNTFQLGDFFNTKKQCDEITIDVTDIINKKKELVSVDNKDTTNNTEVVCPKIHESARTDNVNASGYNATYNNLYGKPATHEWPKVYVPPQQPTYTTNYYYKSYMKARKLNPHLVSILHKKEITI